MNRPTTALMLSLLAFVPLAGAQEQTTPVPGSARDWLELQTSGRAASPADRPLPGDIADRTYQRYAESFSQPIPATLDREEFLSQGGGGGGGGGGK
jgi:hypothetical protein